MTGAATLRDPRAESRFARALSALDDGALNEAADLVTQALELAPDWAGAWTALGGIESRRGDIAAAIRAYETALILDPADGHGAAMALAAVTGGVPAAAPVAYVTALFDAYAPRFEAHLTETLGYSGPADIDAALSAAGCHALGHVLDLGCGTGLCGVALRSRATLLTGVDLSAAMVTAARDKGVYDRLAIGDITLFLDDEAAASADTIVMADVLIYVGALGPLLAGAARVLRPGGLLAFTAQTVEHAGAGYVVGPDLCFAYTRSYLEAELAGAGFTVLSDRPKSARRENGRAIPGLVMVAHRT